MHKRLSTFAAFSVIITLGFYAGAKPSNPPVPNILTIPHLTKNLPPGTIAWATIDQLHPTQPQTGKREVERKAHISLEYYQNSHGKFPENFYEVLYRKYIIPVYVGPVAKTDSRFGQEEILAYNTDRTHASAAIALAISKFFGKKTLSKPIYDSKDRPLNFVLVKVLGNESKMSYPEFSRFMTTHRHAYLKFWSELKNENTLIQKIGFKDLPEEVYETTDNPFRSLVSKLQREGILGRATTDFSQFRDAEILAKHSGIKWSDIDENASEKQLKKAEEKAKEFINSGDPVVLTMPGVKALHSQKCGIDLASVSKN